MRAVAGGAKQIGNFIWSFICTICDVLRHMRLPLICFVRSSPPAAICIAPPLLLPRVPATLSKGGCIVPCSSMCCNPSLSTCSGAAEQHLYYSSTQCSGSTAHHTAALLQRQCSAVVLQRQRLLLSRIESGRPPRHGCRPQASDRAIA